MQVPKGVGVGVIECAVFGGSVPGVREMLDPEI